MQPIYDFNSFRNQSRVTKLLYDYSGPEVNLLEDVFLFLLFLRD